MEDKYRWTVLRMIVRVSILLGGPKVSSLGVGESGSDV